MATIREVAGRARRIAHHGLPRRQRHALRLARDPRARHGGDGGARLPPERRRPLAPPGADPHARASCCRTARTRTSPSWAGASRRRPSARDYSVVLCNTEGEELRERVYVDLLTRRQVDGLLYVPAGNRVDVLRDLLQRPLPVVLVDRDLPGAPIDVVLSDKRGGAYLATRHLIALGHRRIGCIGGPSSLLMSGQRLQGYRDALAEAAIPIDESLVAPRGLSPAVRLGGRPEPARARRSPPDGDLRRQRPHGDRRPAGRRRARAPCPGRPRRRGVRRHRARVLHDAAAHDRQPVGERRGAGGGRAPPPAARRSRPSARPPNARDPAGRAGLVRQPA